MVMLGKASSLPMTEGFGFLKGIEGWVNSFEELRGYPK